MGKICSYAHMDTNRYFCCRVLRQLFHRSCLNLLSLRCSRIAKIFHGNFWVWFLQLAQHLALPVCIFFGKYVYAQQAWFTNVFDTSLIAQYAERSNRGMLLWRYFSLHSHLFQIEYLHFFQGFCITVHRGCRSILLWKTYSCWYRAYFYHFGDEARHYIWTRTQSEWHMQLVDHRSVHTS